MDYVIDLGSELLVDRSQVPTGQLRLLLKAVGRPLVSGSPWTVVNKRVAMTYRPLLSILGRPRKQASTIACGWQREGEAPAEPGISSELRLGRSLALPELATL